jgi:hypothetical protein
VERTQALALTLWVVGRTVLEQRSQAQAQALESSPQAARRVWAGSLRLGAGQALLRVLKLTAALTFLLPCLLRETLRFLDNSTQSTALEHGLC